MHLSQVRHLNCRKQAQKAAADTSDHHLKNNADIVNEHYSNQENTINVNSIQTNVALHDICYFPRGCTPSALRGSPRTCKIPQGTGQPRPQSTVGQPQRLSNASAAVHSVQLSISRPIHTSSPLLWRYKLPPTPPKIMRYSWLIKG